MTKKELVLMHLMEHGSITSMESFEKFKATRLSGIIFNLKKEGYVIDTVSKKGADCVYAEYVYKGKIDRPYYQLKEKQIEEKKEQIKELEQEVKEIEDEIVKTRDNDENLYDKKTNCSYLF